MSNRDEVSAEEERLRGLVRELPDEKRARFFRLSQKQIKDPDTYAVLNWLFVSGLHHFYLGRWVRGSLALLLFLASIPLLFITGAGFFLLILLFVIELPALFRSQLIVQNHNNRVMAELLAKVAEPLPRQ